MPKTRFAWSVLIMITTLLGSGWIVYSREPARPESFYSAPEAPIVGHLAPDFTLSTPSGETVTLTELVDRSGAAGQPVVLNFWATWCGPCRIEMPHFQRASEDYSGRVAFVSINQAEGAEAITRFGNEYSITYPLLVDSDSTTNNIYGIHSLPTTIFIDANGTVREVIVGTINQAVLQDRIGRLLAEIEK